MKTVMKIIFFCFLSDVNKNIYVYIKSSETNSFDFVQIQYIMFNINMILSLLFFYFLEQVTFML